MLFSVKPTAKVYTLANNCPSHVLTHGSIFFTDMKGTQLSRGKDEKGNSAFIHFELGSAIILSIKSSTKHQHLPAYKFSQNSKNPARNNSNTNAFQSHIFHDYIPFSSYQLAEGSFKKAV